VSHDVVLCRGLADASAAWDRARHLAERAADALKQPRVRIRVHRNRRTLIRWRVQRDAFEIGVHHAFLPHPDDVLAVVLHRDDEAWRRLRALPRDDGAPQLATEGHAHDLQALLGPAVDAIHWPMGPPSDLVLGWGRWPTQPPRRNLRLGSCAAGPPPVVRMHPVLDHADVPDYFVGFVIFHELLHLRFPPLVEGRRRVVHPRSFRMAEQRHPDHARATAWETKHVGAMLARARAHVLGRRRRRS
jgi:hypothetical protein